MALWVAQMETIYLCSPVEIEWLTMLSAIIMSVHRFDATNHHVGTSGNERGRGMGTGSTIARGMGITHGKANGRGEGSV